MNDKPLKIAVLASGDNSESEVSKRSAQSVSDALSTLAHQPYECHVVEIYPHGWFCRGVEVDRGEFSLPGVGRFDYALNMVHGTPGENGPLQGYLEMLGIPHSTASAGVMAITFDKKLCKSALRGTAGVNLAKEIIVNQGEQYNAEELVEELGLPFFVKPTCSGSSCGVVKVKTAEQIASALATAHAENSEAMCEEFIGGVEISQGVMEMEGGEITALPITELVTEREFFDYTAKYTAGLTDEITPARLSDELTAKVSETTRTIYRTLGCRGVVRIDYIIQDDTPYFIELNGVPGMSPQSIIPQQWAHIGLSIGEGFEIIINNNNCIK